MKRVYVYLGDLKRRNFHDRSSCKIVDVQDQRRGEAGREGTKGSDSNRDPCVVPVTWRVEDEVFRSTERPLEVFLHSISTTR